MKKRLLFVFLLAFLSAGIGLSEEAVNASPALRAEVQPDAITVWCGDKIFTQYKFAKDQKYPYFYPVNGPQSGESVTTETSEPYPHHHSLFFGCDRVNEGNYWQDVNDRGQILSQKIEASPIADASGQCQTIVIKNECLWSRPGAPSPFSDQRIITLSAPSPQVRLIDFEITMTALMDVTILKTNHSLFSARMTPELSVKSGGTLRNAQGDLAEADTFGKESLWCDYYGTRNGVTEGLAILSHPSNRWHPPQWFTRDYGFFSPTPMEWIPGDQLVFKKDETLHLKYRVVVHTGDSEQAQIAKLYEQWANQ